MHIAVKEIDYGFYRIRWIVGLDEAERGQTFQLNRLHPSPIYVITCQRDPSPPPSPPLRPRRSSCSLNAKRYHPPVYPLSGRLTLVRAESSEPVESKRQKTEQHQNHVSSENHSPMAPDDLEYSLKSVWIHSNTGKRLYFHNSPPSEAWELHSTNVDFDREWDQENSRWLVKIKFWLRFERLTGARNELKQFNDLLTLQKGCDVTFRFENDEQIGAHATVLTARSQVLARLVTSEFAKTKDILINDTTPDIFNHLLHYVYCSEMPVMMDENLAKSLYLAAIRYEIDDLKKECSSYLVHNLNVTNVIDVFLWSHTNNIQNIREVCTSFIIRHAKDVSHSNEYEDLLKMSPDLFLMITRKITEKLPSSTSDEDSSEIEEEYTTTESDSEIDSGSEDDP